MEKNSVPLATRAFIISDLHLGGRVPHMMSRPSLLRSFLVGLPARCADDERLELIVAGDFIDFLAIPPFAGFTPDPSAATTKLIATVDQDPFKTIFDAMKGLIAQGATITVLVGNHDVELALPHVQDALRVRLCADLRQLMFRDDGRAYRIGRALIEHGNRYDGANRNDWTNLRAITSAQSRGDTWHDIDYLVSPGSLSVARLFNHLKKDYPFVDLLQPQSLVSILLLHELEPRIASLLGLIGSYFWEIPTAIRAHLHRAVAGGGARPNAIRNIVATEQPADPELESLFGQAYRNLINPPNHIAANDNWPIPNLGKEQGIAYLLRNGLEIPAERLLRIRRAFQKALPSLPAEPASAIFDDCTKAARRMFETGQFDVIVMGHTHDEREYFWSTSNECASYINTGAWADVIRPSSAALENNEVFRSFLDGLFGVRDSAAPTFADLRIGPDGHVAHARLHSFKGTGS